MKALDQFLNLDAIFAAVMANEVAYWGMIVCVGVIVYWLLSGVMLCLFRLAHALEEEEDQLRQRMEEEIKRRNLKEFRTRR